MREISSRVLFACIYMTKFASPFVKEAMNYLRLYEADLQRPNDQMPDEVMAKCGENSVFVTEVYSRFTRDLCKLETFPQLPRKR